MDLDSQIALVEAAPAAAEKEQLTAETGRAQDVVEYDGVFGEDTALRRFKMKKKKQFISLSYMPNFFY